MIKRIVIRSVASYDEKGVVFDDLQKVNFIYGGNGTGKTTVGRVLQSTKRKKEYPKCKVEWDGDEQDVLVYNKDFRERNFAEYIPGIFTLGENMVAEEKEMERLQREKDEQLRRVGAARQDEDRLQNEIAEERKTLEEKLWQKVYLPNSHLKRYIGEFAEEKHFADKMIALCKSNKQGNHQSLSEKALDRRIQTLYPKDEPEQWKELGTIEELSQITVKERQTFWKEPLLKSQDYQLRSLVKDEALSKKMIKIVDAQYRENYSKIETLANGYAQLIETIGVKAEKMINKSRMMSSELLDTYAFGDKMKVLMSILNENHERMADKLENPKKEITLMSTVNHVKLLKQMIKEANNKVRLHNKSNEEILRKRKKLKNDIMKKLAMDAKEYVMEANRVILAKEKDLNNVKVARKAAAEAYYKLDRQIKEKHEGVVSIRPTVDHINKALRQFGFTGFRLQPSPEQEHHYQIEREDGSLVKDTLSEGEVTFITFLYFMQRAVQKEGDRKRVLVIDDPISSLDSSVMFVVGTMIRQLISAVKAKENVSSISQIFVLTHNVYFHKEVTFINNRANRSKDCYHWMLYKHGGVTSAKACLTENPVRGSYDLLWKELRDWKEHIVEMDNIRLQNILRRIIENYFVVFGGKSLKRLMPENFSEDAEEKAIALSFARWYDEGSHDIMDDLYVEAPQVLNERYMTVFRKVFEKLGHIEHYKMMMREEIDR